MIIVLLLPLLLLTTWTLILRGSEQDQPVMHAATSTSR